MGRIDLPDKYRDEDYAVQQKEVRMDEFNYFSIINPDEMTLQEEEAIESVLKPFTKKKKTVNRSGTTIGSDIPRLPGKGSNADISKCRGR